MGKSSKCRLCRKDSLGTLCPSCENQFNNHMKYNYGIDVKLKIGSPCYIIKKGVGNSLDGLSIHEVIYRGPNSNYLIKLAESTGPFIESIFKYNFTYNKKDSFACYKKDKDGKNEYFYRSLDDIFCSNEEVINRLNNLYLKHKPEIDNQIYLDENQNGLNISNTSKNITYKNEDDFFNSVGISMDVDDINKNIDVDDTNKNIDADKPKEPILKRIIRKLFRIH